MNLLPVLPALLLILGAVLIGGLRWARPGFKYFWLVAAGGSALGWIAVLAVRLAVPISGQALTWPVSQAFDFSLSLVWDQVSWPLALAVAALALGATLADVQRAPEADWLAWSSGLLLAGLAVLCVLSGSLATLIVSLAALDLFWAAQSLLHDPESRQAYRGLAARMVGIGLILWAGGAIFIRPEPSAAVAFILLAVMLRLSNGQAAGPRSTSSGRFRVSLYNLAPAAGGVALLVRTLPELSTPSPAVQILIGLVGLLAALVWASVTDEVERNAAWQLGVAALVAAAALSGRPQSGVAWGLGLLLSGGLLSLLSLRWRWFLLLPLISLWAFSGLPISPTWDGMGLFGGDFSPTLVLLLLAHGGLLAGYLRQALHEDDDDHDLERWVRLIYPLGLGVLPFSQVLVAWWPWRGYDWLVSYPWWPGLAAAAIGALIWWFQDYVSVAGTYLAAALAAFRTGTGRLIASLFGVVGHGVAFLSTVLEGEGGVLWALLLLALLVTVVLQSGLGGAG